MDDQRRTSLDMNLGGDVKQGTASKALRERGRCGGLHLSEDVARVTITAGACLGGLLAATPQAFNAISKNVMLDTHTSDVFISLMTGFGLAGLQFTIFAGISLDTLGAWKTCFIGNCCIVLGYVSLSFTTTPWLLVLELALVGLGSGAAFLSGFKSVIELGNPLGVGLTSCAMSVSIFLTIAMGNALMDSEDCHSPACWRHVVRLDAIVCGLAFLLAGGALSLRWAVPALVALDNGSAGADTALADHVSEDAEAPRRRHVSGDSDPSAAGKHRFAERRRRSSAYSLGSASVGRPDRARRGCSKTCAACYGGLFVFRDLFFWRLALADVAGIGIGVFVLASARQLWSSFDAESNEGPAILKVFSVLAAVANVAYPVLADVFHRRGWISRIRLMGVTLAIYGVVMGAILLLNMHAGQGETDTRPSAGSRTAMFALMASCGFGFGAALVGFPVCVSSTFPVEFFGTILSYVQMAASTFSIVAATVTAGTFHHFGSYTPMYLAMTVLMFVGALMLVLPRRCGKQPDGTDSSGSAAAAAGGSGERAAGATSFDGRGDAEDVRETLLGHSGDAAKLGTVAYGTVPVE